MLMKGKKSHRQLTHSSRLCLENIKIKINKTTNPGSDETCRLYL